MWWNYYWPMPWFGPLFMILAIAFLRRDDVHDDEGHDGPPRKPIR